MRLKRFARSHYMPMNMKINWTVGRTVTRLLALVFFSSASSLSLSLYLCFTLALPCSLNNRKVNLFLLQNSTLIFQIDKHFRCCFCYSGLQGVLCVGGGGQCAKGSRSKVAHFRLPFLFFVVVIIALRAPLAFQLAAGITFFGGRQGIAGKGQGRSCLSWPATCRVLC